MYELSFMYEEEVLTGRQRELVDTVINNINQILNLNGLKKWCEKSDVGELIIFGSRTTLLNRKDSDLDIMVSSYQIEGVTEDNFIKVQRNAINKLFHSFGAYVLDKSIELDFKLNISQDEDYYGITYLEEIDDCGEVDFCFQAGDIPSYISITKDKIAFTFAEPLDYVFDEASFCN